MMKEEVAIGVLKQVKEILDDHDIEYWLDQGTLLGAVRDGKFIPWDHDVDLGTWQENVVNIVSAFQKHRDRFRTYLFEGRANITIIVEGVYVDIRAYRLTGDKATKEAPLMKQTVVGHTTEHLFELLLSMAYMEVNPEELKVPFITMPLLKIIRALPFSWRERLTKIAEILHKKIGCFTVQKVVPSHYYTNLSTIMFYGMEFKVPAATEEYLTYKFGENWNIPKRHWIPSEDDGTIIHAGR